MQSCHSATYLEVRLKKPIVYHCLHVDIFIGNIYISSYNKRKVTSIKKEIGIELLFLFNL